MKELPDGSNALAGAEGETSLSDVIEQLLDEVRREKREVALMLEQSQHEVNRLGKKSASVVAYVKQMREQEQWEEMASACESALDAQQRHLIMRAQMDKLQQAYDSAERFEAALQKLQALVEQESSTASASSRNSIEVLEMLIRAQEAERQRLSRQMHDGPAQALSNFILQTEIASRLFEVDPERARQELQALKSSASRTFQQVREFIFDLRPMMLDDLGLLPTVKRYLEMLDNQVDATIDLKISGSDDRRYSDYLEAFAFRTVQDLVGDAVHQRKADRVEVQLALEEKRVKIVVEDDGEIVDEDVSSKPTTMLGLLRERVEMSGGSLEVERAGGRNRIEVEVLVPQGR